jgi:AcrR family transcriptional regulator
VTTTPPRRTQAERRASTRAAVLQATVDELYVRGFAQASTVEIAERAGVSQGSVFRYFPTKDDLFVATCEWVLDAAPDLVEGFMGTGSADPDLRTRLRTALQALYDAFVSPPFVAVTELQVGARTRPELAARLSAALGARWPHLALRAVPWFGDLAHRPDFPQLLGMIVDTVRGWALSQDTEIDIVALYPDGPDMLDLLADLLVTSLEADGRPPGT